jgi:hypothetical protein
LVSGGHHGFFKQLGFGNLRCLTFELAYVNIKRGKLLRINFKRFYTKRDPIFAKAR